MLVSLQRQMKSKNGAWATFGGVCP